MESDDLVAKLKWHNGMILLSNTEEEIGESQSQLLPCKKVMASTPWKRQRDEILYAFLDRFDKQNKPVLIFSNSVFEVNLITASLRSQFPTLSESAIKAIGTNMSVTVLKTELTTQLQFEYLILSAQMALAAFVHGIIKIKDFSLLCFADARGANQNHPFCVIMNNFYTPLRYNCHPQNKPRVIGFSEMKSLKEIEIDMFSRRDWIKTLKHYMHTFHSIPLAVGHDVVSSLLEDLNDSILFDPLSIYETVEIEPSNGYPVVTDLIPEMTANFDIIVLKHETEDVSALYEFLKIVKLKGIKRVIHVQRIIPQISARLSLFAALKNLKLAAEAPSNRLDPDIASNLTRDASTLFSQSDHILSIKTIEHIIRNPKTESLLIESTAIPILVRCCTLLSRQFRQSSANETIKFKTIRVFPLNSEGQKTSTFFNHLSLLKLPDFLYEKIKITIKTPATIDSDQFHIQGPVAQSRHQAQCCVAFEAAKLLLSAGILDDNLMLAEEFRREETEGTEINDSECLADDMETVEENSEKNIFAMSFNEIIPRALLKGPKLFIYALEYELKMHGTLEDPLASEPEPILLTPFSRLLLTSTPSIDFFSISKSNRSWSILLPSPLPSTFVPVEIPLGTDHFLKTNLKFIDEIFCDSREYEELLKMQQCLFGMFNMKPITVPDSEDLVVKRAADFVPGDKQPFYLIAPLTSTSEVAEEMTDLKDIPRLWDIFKSFAESFKVAPLAGTLYSSTQISKRDFDWKIDWELLSRLNDESSVNLSLYIEELDKYPKDLSIQLEEGGVLIDFKRFALERLSFYTPHTKIFYRLSRPIIEPIYPSSPFSSPSYPHATTHAEYVQARYNLNVTDMEKEMLAVKRVENWSDLAVWISDDGASKKRRKKSSITTNSNSNAGILPGTSLIIPELTRVFPASYSTFRAAMFLPRVSFEIERQLRIAQFFEDRLPATLTKPKHLRQIEAMTASTASLSYSYEQLEVLGDSFLKYYSTLDTLLVGAGWSEGRLSSHRQRILCNATLRKAAENLQLTSYASFTPFFAKLWCPPALISSLPVPSDSLNSALDQVLFAPEERWKALAGVEGKQVQKQVIYLLDVHGKLSVDENYKTKEQAKNSTDAIYKYGQLIPPKSLADIVEALIGIYYIDGGVQGALQFLVFCGILRTEIFRVRELDPLMLILGDGRIGHEEQLEKLKRRKITPMTNIILSSQTSSESTDSTTFSELLKETQALTAPVGQKIENVQPNVPSFAAFPFADLESSLSYAFLHRELAFMACTHTSADLKLNGEKLEWIGDAAIDWIVCRHYWYNYRLKTADDDEFEEGAVTLGADNSSGDSSSSKPREHDLCAFNSTNNNLEHPNVCHIPKGYLPLSPESLTNSRQSAINNEAFARLVIKNDLHRFLRINSPHLQIEIERFAEELSKQAGGGGEAGNTSKLGNNILTPEALEGFQTHVSVAAPKVLGDLFESLMGALLLDTNFDIECFSTLFEPFLNSICPDPSSLPINAIQETLHLYARLGIPRHQIVCTYKSISESDNQCLGVICQVWVRERCVAEAEGSNKLVAKKLAMESALKELINNSTNYP